MSVKILHTADWHLGKKLFREDRSKEHESFLNWLEDTLQEEKIDLLIIAGDIFDLPSPPHASIEQFNNFLYRVSNLRIKVFIIGGNHDSATLLESPAPFYHDKDIVVVGKLKQDQKDHIHYYKIKDEEFLLQSLPYFRNQEIFKWFKDSGYEDQDSDERGGVILEILKNFFHMEKNVKGPKILVSHHLFGSFIPAESEQSLNLSGVESIPVSILKGAFDYVALGHIHKPQIINKEDPLIAYSGSPIAMRFSEKEKKSVQIITVNNGILSTEKKEIPTFMKLIQLRTTFKDLEKDLKEVIETNKEKFYLEVLIKLKEPQSGLVDLIHHGLEKTNGKLLSYYPLYEDIIGNKVTLDRQKIHDLSTTELFEKFYKDKFPDSEIIPEDILNEFKNILEKSQEELNLDT